jgi:hypothetical protein
MNREQYLQETFPLPDGTTYIQSLDRHNSINKMKPFQEYHEENPSIYEEFKKFSFQLIQSGHSKIGAKQVAERIRWETMTQKKGKFKFNNNYTADYARKFEADHPEHIGLFEKRIRKTY